MQLRWNPDPAVLLPQEGFILTIYFIDPNVAEEVLQPGSYSVLPLIPVESYDITITSDDGTVLWDSINQMPAGGRAVERVIFANEYRGPITIELSDITSRDRGTDSVTFNARVIENS